MPTRKKSATRSRKKTTAKRGAVRKKAAKRKSPAKKAAKKKAVKKKSTAKKTAKKTARKKQAARKATKKKKATRKKAAAGKKTVRKKAKKAAAGKKTTARKKARKAAAGKKTTARKKARKAAARKPAPRKKKTARRRGRRWKADLLVTGPVEGIEPYKLGANERYMNDKQLKHFEMLLNAWKHELMEEVDRTVHHMKDEAANFPDPNDRATQESEFSLELRTRDRERKLIKKIDEALITVDSGEYGYCESCGIEIGVRRLEARPTATQCIDCKTLDEIREKQMRA